MKSSCPESYLLIQYQDANQPLRRYVERHQLQTISQPNDLSTLAWLAGDFSGYKNTNMHGMPTLDNSDIGYWSHGVVGVIAFSLLSVGTYFAR